MEQKMRFE